jgi:hypothetical protein
VNLRAPQIASQGVDSVKFASDEPKPARSARLRLACHRLVKRRAALTGSEVPAARARSPASEERHGRETQMHFLRKCFGRGLREVSDDV